MPKSPKPFPARIGLAYDETIARAWLSKHPRAKLQYDTVRWLVAKALDPRELTELVNGPSLPDGSRGCPVFNGVIDADVAKVLAHCFCEVPDEAADVWTFARREGKKKVATRLHKAREVIQLQNFVGSVNQSPKKDLSYKSLLSAIEKKHGRGANWEHQIEDAIKAELKGAPKQGRGKKSH